MIEILITPALEKKNFLNLVKSSYNKFTVHHT